MTESENIGVKILAEVVLKIGQVHPHRRKRLGFIKNNNPDLWARMIEIKLIYPDEFFDRDSDDFEEEDFDFENLCEYAEAGNENYLESEIEDENNEKEIPCFNHAPKSGKSAETLFTRNPSRTSANSIGGISDPR